jgi:glycosyltransferase involved in cell wall biosynthesis
VAIDVAGGDRGGAARWREELDLYLAGSAQRVLRIGDRQRVTPTWLLHRESLTRRCDLVVAPNNVSFAVSGSERRVVLRNALHFLYPDEEHLLRRMPRSFRAQVPVVRALLRRADLAVVPCAAMADRVAHHVPAVVRRLVVRAHPVSVLAPRRPGADRCVLVPVVPGPYKNLVEQLQLLVAAMVRLGDPVRVQVTASPDDLPPDLAAHPAVDAVGVMSPRRLATLWASATAAFYPSAIEAFGYPLAEARCYGVPIIAPDTEQGREIAGPALCGYDPRQPETLADALIAAYRPVAPDPVPFDRGAYFSWLLDGDVCAALFSPQVGAPAPHGLV